MTDRLIVPADERGVIRVFALDRELGREIDLSSGLDSLHRALGIEHLRTEDVQIVELRVIADMGLPAFLSEAYGVDPAQIDPHADALKAQDGEIAILRSAAFDGQMALLITDGQATLIATFNEPVTDWSAKPMQTPVARRRIAPRTARSAARRIGFALFSAIMLLLLLIVLWVAT